MAAEKDPGDDARDDQQKAPADEAPPPVGGAPAMEAHSAAPSAGVMGQPTVPRHEEDVEARPEERNEQPYGSGGDLLPLHDKALNGDLDRTKELLDGGANISEIGGYGITPLGIALGLSSDRCEFKIMLRADGATEPR